jgi:uncharacterized membrane protein YbhN (UPF0104 family)
VVALALAPWGLRLGSALLVRVAPRLAARVPALGAAPGAVYGACLCYGASTVANTAAFVLLAAGMLSVRPGDTGLLVGAVQAASIVGVLSVAPAGIGVREALLVVLLGPRFGAGDALAVAVAWRAWALAFELVWLVVGSVATRLARSGAGSLAK